METTGIIIWGYIGMIEYILGLYRDSGKENGSYCMGYWENTRIMEKKMETMGMVGFRV